MQRSHAHDALGHADGGKPVINMYDELGKVIVQ